MRKNHNKKNSSSLNQNLLGSNVQMTDLDTNNRNNPYISTDFDNNELNNITTSYNPMNDNDNPVPSSNNKPKKGRRASILLDATAKQQSHGTSSSPITRRKSTKNILHEISSSKFNDEIAKAEGYRWDFIIVLPTDDNAVKAEEKAQESGATFLNSTQIISTIINAGLQIYLYKTFAMNENGEENQVLIVKIRGNLERIKFSAASVSFPVQLDPLAVADICENGILNPSEDIEGYLLEPLSINKDQKYSKYNPYDHIYVSYNDDPRLEPLWKCADGLNHPFSSTSRIKLLMTIITSSDERGCGLDLEKLKSVGAILAYFPLPEIDKVQWLDDNFFKSQVWKQPLREMREYLGAKLGLYFTFLSHYTTWLIPLGFVGTVEALDIAINSIFLGESFGKALETPTTGVIFALFVSFWSQVMLEYWKRKQARVGMEWGISDIEQLEVERSSYSLDPELVVIPSYIDGKPILHYPDKIKRQRIFKSMYVTVLLILCVCGAVGLVFYIKFVMITSDDESVASMAGTVSSIANALLIQTLNTLYHDYAVELNERENHRTETEYENSLIIKLFCFNFVNSYAPLYYIAFMKAAVGDLCDPTCMGELSLTLTIIFITNVTVGNAQELSGPIYDKVMEYCYPKSDKGDGSDGYNNDKKMSLVEQQYKLADYDVTMNLIDDYSELSIQYGYVTLFVTACPIAPILAYISNLVEVNVDGFNILHASRRPLPSVVNSIGSWLDIFQIISLLAGVTNSAVVCFTMNIFDTTSEGRVWIFILLQYFIFASMWLFEIMIDDIPREVTIQLERREFIKKYIVDMDLDTTDDEYDLSDFQVEVPEVNFNDDETINSSTG